MCICRLFYVRFKLFCISCKCVYLGCFTSGVSCIVPDDSSFGPDVSRSESHVSCFVADENIFLMQSLYSCIQITFSFNRGMDGGREK